MAPIPVEAAEINFTSLNDNLQPLTADTMPVWSGGQIYAPYGVFNASSTGVNLGLFSSYSRDTNMITVYGTRNGSYEWLIFDLNSGTCWNETTSVAYPARAIVRNGTPYLPVSTVCQLFGLTYSYTAIPSVTQGYLLRIKNSAVVLSDSKFIDAASNSISRRLREYNQSLVPAPDPEPPANPSVTNPVSPSASDVSTFLALTCQAQADAAGILTALDEAQVFALFLFTPQALQENDALARQILGSGHCLGLLAEGDDLPQTQELLTQGNQLLAQLACARTTIALVPDDQRSALEDEGWICWEQTLALSPSADVSANSFASGALRSLGQRTQQTYLTLPCSAQTGRVLPSLLRQLKANHFVVSTPLEPML
jgi:hypothetical protein